jgi:predicted MFS family arabinose efflux permease
VAQPALTSGRWQIAWWAAMAATVLMALWTWRIQARRAITFAGGAAAPSGSGRLTLHERRSLWLAGIAFLLFSGQYYAYMTWLPQYLVETFGFGPDEALVGYLVPVVMLGIWNVIGGWLLRHGLKAGPMLALGMLLQGACWFLLPWTDAGWRGLASLLVYGIGAGLAPTALFAMPSSVVGPGRPLVQAFGIIMMARNVGVLLGPVVLAQLSKLAGGWQLSAPIFGGVSAASAALGLWLTLRLRRR